MSDFDLGNIDLAHDVFVVTGASSGMGRDFAEKVSARGGRVVFVARSDAATTGIDLSRNPNASYFQADVGDPDKMRLLHEMVHQKYGKFGKLYLLASAGTADKKDPNLERTNVGGFNNLFNVFEHDLRAPEHQGSFLVGFSSIAADQNVLLAGDERYKESKEAVARRAAEIRATTNGQFNVLTYYPGIVPTKMATDAPLIALAGLQTMQRAVNDSSLRIGLAAYLGLSPQQFNGWQAGQFLLAAFPGQATTAMQHTFGPNGSLDLHMQAAPQASSNIGKLQTLTIGNPTLDPAKGREYLVLMSLLTRDKALQAQLIGVLNFLNMSVPIENSTARLLQVLASGTTPPDGSLRLFSSSGLDPVVALFKNAPGDAIDFRALFAKEVARHPEMGRLPAADQRSLVDKAIQDLPKNVGILTATFAFTQGSMEAARSGSGERFYDDGRRVDIASIAHDSLDATYASWNRQHQNAPEAPGKTDKDESEGKKDKIVK